MTNNTVQTSCRAPLGHNLALSTSATMSTLWVGAGWKIFCCACFAAINGIVRYLGGGASFAPDMPLPTNVIMFFQNVFGTLFLLPILLSRPKLHHILPRQHLKLHFLRVFAAVLGVGLWYFTLKKMPIAIGVALSFTGPMFTVMGAKLFLGEHIGGQRAFAICLSLLGAFIISRPDLAFFGKETSLGLVMLLPLGSALALVWNKLLTRKLAGKGETAESLAAILLLLMAPVSLLLALPEWITPIASHWPWLILLGLLAALAHVSFGKAYAKAEVIFLTPIGFSKFLFSTMIGYYFFLEIPSSSLWMGMSVIGISVMLLVYQIPYTIPYKIFYKMPLYSIAKRFKSS